jgi:hypothetical protein
VSLTKIDELALSGVGYYIRRGDGSLTLTPFRPTVCFCYTLGLRDRDMATITFDTLKFVEKLKASGIPDEQAKAIVEAFRDAQSDVDLVTKKDLQIELAPLKSDLLLLKWMVGLVLGGIIALILKSFFPG